MIPTTAVRAAWSSASFLFYLGAFVVLFATSALIGLLAGAHGDAAFTGWSALVVVVTTAAALLLRRAGRDVLAGLAAFLDVAFVGLFAGSLVTWIGLAPDTSHGFLPRSFEPGLYLTEFAIVAAAVAAIHCFRFPLLVLPLAATLLYALADVGTALFGGGSGDGVPTIFAALGGIGLAAAGIAADRSGRREYGFWLHVLAGLALGEVLIYLGGRGELGWFVVAAGALAYVEAARVLARSSYAVFGAIGVLIVSTHWIGKWLGSLDVVPFVHLGSGGRPEPWHIALAYVAVGCVIVLLGIRAERVRR